MRTAAKEQKEKRRDHRLLSLQISDLNKRPRVSQPSLPEESFYHNHAHGHQYRGYKYSNCCDVVTTLQINKQVTGHFVCGTRTLRN